MPYWQLFVYTTLGVSFLVTLGATIAGAQQDEEFRNFLKAIGAILLFCLSVLGVGAFIALLIWLVLYSGLF